MREESKKEQKGNKNRGFEEIQGVLGKIWVDLSKGAKATVISDVVLQCHGNPQGPLKLDGKEDNPVSSFPGGCGVAAEAISCSGLVETLMCLLRGSISPKRSARSHYPLKNRRCVNTRYCIAETSFPNC